MLDQTPQNAAPASTRAPKQVKGVSTAGVPLLLLGVAPDIMFEEQTLSRDVGRVLSVLVIVQLLSSFSSSLCLWVIG